MVGDLEKSSFSNIEQQSLEFVKYTLEPWLIRWEQSMARVLISQGDKADYFIKFNGTDCSVAIMQAVCPAMPQQGRTVGCQRMISVNLRTLTVFLPRTEVTYTLSTAT